MKKYFPKLFFVFAFSLFSNFLFGQGPGSLFVDAGPDALADCASGGCVDITATFLDTYETASENYTVTSIPYNPPFPFNGLSNQMNPNQDDQWSVVETLPFDFCFFGNLETQFQVGSNGVLRFDVDATDVSNAWQFNSDLPNNVEEALAEANVFTPVHDIDPSPPSNSEEIGYEVLGTYPNRVLVVSYFEVPMYSSSCSTLEATQMAVFYEFSNVIEIYIRDKPVCNTWNSGNAALGIQNNAGTVAYVPPGRNTSDSPWTATNEAWSFTPIGAPTFVFEWLDSAGNVIGNTPTITVCPSGGSETYTAHITYTNNCNGDVVDLFDDVVVTTSAPFTVDLGPDITTCDSNPIILDASANAPANAMYEWFFNGVSQGAASNANPTFTVTAPNSGTYSVTVYDPADPTCLISDSIEITFLNQPIIDAPAIDLFICDDGTTPGIFDLTVNTPIILGSQNPADYNITYHNSQTDADTGANPIPTPATYTITGSNETICVRIEDLTGTCFATDCFEITYAAVTAGAITPNPYPVCDQDQDGTEMVNLPALFDTMTLNGQSPLQYNVTYFLSQADADNNIGALPNPYAVTSSPTTIFIRVENNANPICFDTSQNFEIILDAPPAFTAPPTYILCDDNNDGFFDFDLSVMDAVITGGDPNLAVTYHDTQANADAGILPLPTIYTNNVQYNDVVYVRVESLVSSCYSTTTLDLEVRDSPLIVDPQPLRMCDYNNTGDGFEFFDLTLSEPEVLNGLDPTQYDIYYYEDITDAQTAGDAALTAPDYSQAIPGAQTTNYQNLTNPQTIYVLVVGNGTSTTSNPNGASGCYNIAELQLIVDPLPATVTPTDRYELCDDAASGSTTDGLSFFDLTTWNGFITNNNIALTVIWFETLADEAADNPIADPTAFQNTIINEQTVFARVVDGNGCKVIVPLTLRVNPNPSPVIPTPLEVCDDDYDGFVQFTLTDKDIEIIGGEPDVIIEGYYNTQLLAENGDVADHLPIPYTNVVINTEQVWARAENTLTGCYTAVPLQLVVNPLPALPQIPGFGDLTRCDENGDGTALFNLEDNTPYLNGGLPLTDMTYGYYDNLIDAQAGNPPIAGTTAFPSMGQTIWVRVENTLTGCFRIDSFELIVGTYPVITTPAEMEVCDDAQSGSTTDGLSTFDLTQNNALITGGDITLQVFYYETLADQTANNPIVTPEAYQNTTNPQVIYISVYNQTGCSASTTVTLNVLPVPTPVTPTDLEVCDDDNDGFAQFDLTQKDAEIIGGQVGVTVTYYVLETEAQAGTPSIPDPTVYQNINPNVQTVWARAEFTIPPNDSGCFAVVPLNLVVLPTPVIDTLPDLLLCDTDGNNEETFDLTQQEPLIYGGQDPTDFLPVTYYDNPTDAQAGTGNIAVPTAYTGTAGQVIYVRLEFIATGCYTIGQFTLQVGTLPTVVPPTTYQLCDDLDEPNDGITIFDLTTKNNEITAGVLGIDVRYYETYQDAQDDTNRIDPETAYQNQTNPQTIYVRVIDGNIPDCPNFTTLTIEVLPNPTPATPQPIALCDDDNPGDEQEVFDLTVREGEILNGGSWDVTYHESLNDALSGTPQIATPTAYTNTSNPQTIYVRVTNPLSPLGCFEIVELPVIVNPLPDDTAAVEDYIICEVPFDGLAEFDLTTKIDEILNGQDPSIYQVSFYESLADAQAMTDPIVNTTTHQNIDVVTGAIINPQTIYTGILNTDTGCYIGGVQTFNLEVKEGAEATSPDAPFTICDNLNQNDGIATFDLTDAGLQSEILNGQDPAQYQISFYATIEDAATGNNPLPGSYVNIINPQVIYAVVTNDANTAPKCTALAEVILKVEELPGIQLEAGYRVCLDANNNPIPEEEGALSPPVLETGLDPNLYVFQWELDGSILFDEIGSSMVARQGGTYTVTATELATGCSNTQSTTVTVSQPPLQYDAQVISGAFANIHTIEATATGLGSYVFSLDDGPFQSGGTFTDVSAGEHTVTIKDENGCGSVVIEVGVIDYPRYFTPNNDGYHDRWNIIGIATGDPTAKIYIFDRFGKLIKQLSPLSEGWDGTYNGNPLPSSDYWFRVEYTEQDVKKEFKGHFTLKR